MDTHWVGLFFRFVVSTIVAIQETEQDRTTGLLLTLKRRASQGGGYRG